MIATIHGSISLIEENALVVEVGGVGMRVFVPAPLLAKIKVGESILLHTHLAVREDALTLYGFNAQSDRQLFDLLLGVDGVGPKVALAVLSTLSPDTVRRAVANEEAELLSRVPGIGKKTAQKIVLYLQDRIKPADILEGVAFLTDIDNEVLAALTALGYSVVEAQTAIQSIPKDAPESVEERLRLALQNFTGS
ncbi:MAG: Holliday junction branch migration protein RuvA [Anaerolineales bacterium]|nr:Holliday junction branch migration protein RuvA [Anaerolineales bacterium]